MGLFDLFKKGLQKTRDKIVSGFKSILTFGRRIDEGLLDELSDAMLKDDMGPRTVTSLLEELRTAWKAGQISEAQEIVPFLKRRIVETWSPGDRAVHFS